MLPPIDTGPRTLISKNPRDQWSTYTVLWAGWIAAFALIETAALVTESRLQQAGTPDRVKRTLSSHWRTWFATDSVTGIPLDVRYGKLRRLVGGTALFWFDRHSKREGEM